jgi:hypothetical protein
MDYGWKKMDTDGRKVLRFEESGAQFLKPHLLSSSAPIFAYPRKSAASVVDQLLPLEPLFIRGDPGHP